MKHWATSPPIHLMLASYFGIKVGEKKEREFQPISDLVGKFEVDPTPLPPMDLSVGSSHCGTSHLRK